MARLHAQTGPSRLEIKLCRFRDGRKSTTSSKSMRTSPHRQRPQSARGHLKVAAALRRRQAARIAAQRNPAALMDPGVRDAMARLPFAPPQQPTTPMGFQQLIAEETVLWNGILRMRNIKLHSTGHRRTVFR
ncbi:hypothetical protein [Bordetella genomosp. 9]|uniref:hypothetical protein n=1 Tax=Bordetella genomosp. 9 TaxID=1416803 RepID=UPI0012FBF9ED|nr:hypothetical protein [Bordetella genomosp. 9]